MASQPEHVFVDKVPDKYNCSICKKVLNEPMLTDCCGQHFCKTCLEEWFEQQQTKTCPYCRKDTFNHIKDIPLQRDINELKIHCPNSTLGCETTFANNETDNHLQKCAHVTVECTNKCGDIMFRKDLDEHLQEYCDRRQVECKYCGKEGMHMKITNAHLRTCTHLPMECLHKCGEEGLIRKTLQDHLEKNCVKRKVLCQHCSEPGTHEHITGDHLDTCPEVPVDCPRKCDEKGLTRKTVDKHGETCPLEPIQCLFLDAGCEDKVPRKDLDEHNTLSVQKHLLLVMTSSTSKCAQIQAENTTLKSEMESLKEELEKLKNEHDDLKNEHQQLKADHYELKTGHHELQSEVLN